MKELEVISEFALYGVYDRGVPNMERVVLRANTRVDMGGFILMLGMRAAGDALIPLRDNTLWFGEGWVNDGDWIFVYTGSGEPRGNLIPNSTENLYSIHWGRPHTMFTSPELVPVLIRMDGLLAPAQLPALAHSQE